LTELKANYSQKTWLRISYTVRANDKDKFFRRTTKPTQTDITILKDNNKTENKHEPVKGVCINGA
jgi:hypothetical protein